ncbi:hypothetical protein QZM82_40200, partial [Burkholderia cepacia]|uniref:hypothetical protein n=1 Tax=Burkholderia cepacia TaxID=292 RepID=UPI0026507F62
LASWLLTAIIDHECTLKSAFGTLIESRTRRLRALEAALFMIGYDLGGGSGVGRNSDAAGSPDTAVLPRRPRRPADGGQAAEEAGGMD